MTLVFWKLIRSGSFLFLGSGPGRLNSDSEFFSVDSLVFFYGFLFSI